MSTLVIYIPSSPPLYVYYKEFYSIFCKRIVPFGPLQKGDNLEIQMDPIPKGSFLIAYQSLLPNPNTFKPDKETIVNGTVETILY